MILHCLRVEALLVGFVEEDLGNDDLGGDVLAVLVGSVRRAIRRIAFGESGGEAEPGRIEEGVRLVDTGIYVTDLDARPGDGSATRSSPSIRRVDDLVTLTQVRMIEGIVLDLLHHRGGCDRLQRRSVELHSNRVDRDIVLACNFCPGRIGSEPSSELVASTS